MEIQEQNRCVALKIKNPSSLNMRPPDYMALCHSLKQVGLSRLEQNAELIIKSSFSVCF